MDKRSRRQGQRECAILQAFSAKTKNARRMTSSSDPSHTIVPSSTVPPKGKITFALRRSSLNDSEHNAERRSISFDVQDLLGDSSSTHRLHKCLLGQSSNHSSRNEHVLLQIEEAEEVATTTESPLDHRRRKVTSVDLNSSFCMLTFDESGQDKTTGSTRKSQHQQDPSTMWVARPKSVADVAGQMYRQYNSMALSLSRSSPLTAANQSYTSHPRLELTDSLVSGSLHTRSVSDINSLLRVQKNSPVGGAKGTRKYASKLDRLNAAMSSMLNASNDVVLSTSLHHQSSLQRIQTKDKKSSAILATSSQVQREPKSTTVSPRKGPQSRISTLASLNRNLPKAPLKKRMPATANTRSRSSITTAMIQKILSKSQASSIIPPTTMAASTRKRAAPEDGDSRSHQILVRDLDLAKESSRFKQNFQWSTNSLRDSRRRRLQRTKAANPFHSIVSSTNAEIAAGVNNEADAPVLSNKRMKVLAADGVTVLSRNSSFAFSEKGHRDESMIVPQKGSVFEEPLAEPVLAGRIRTHSRKQVQSSNNLYHMIRMKHRSKITSMSATNLLKNGTRQRKIVSTRRLRSTGSRANLMSNSFCNDPSYFVTGSRIRRFQSCSSALPSLPYIGKLNHAA